MFIDDTRNVENEATNDPRRRFASITGVIFDLRYYGETFKPRFENMRLRHFGKTQKGRPPLLRRHNIISKEGPFSCLQDSAKEAAWNENCKRLYENAEYTVITTSVDKIAFYYRNPKWTGSIYQLLVQTAIERYFFFLQAQKKSGDVLAESRGKSDLIIKEWFRSMMEKGNGYIKPLDLQRWISSKEIKMKGKGDDIAGLQLADLLAATSFSHCHRVYGGARGPLGFSQEVALILEEKKYHRDRDGNPDRYGRIWRPQN